MEHMISKDPKTGLSAAELNMSKYRGTILVGQLLPPSLLPPTLNLNLSSLS